MKKLYGVIAYRENRSTYYGGSLEGSTDSALNMYQTTCPQEAIEFAARAMADSDAARDEELSPSNYDFVYPVSVRISVNGWLGWDEFCGSTDEDDLFEELEQERENMMIEANTLAVKFFEEYRKEFREKATAIRLAKERKERAAVDLKEREELARLMKKFGVE